MRTVFFHLFLCCLQYLVSSTRLDCTQSEVAGCKTEDHRLNCHISGDAGVFSSVYNLGWRVRKTSNITSRHGEEKERRTWQSRQSESIPQEISSSSRECQKVSSITVLIMYVYCRLNGVYLIQKCHTMYRYLFSVLLCRGASPTYHRKNEPSRHLHDVFSTFKSCMCACNQWRN